MPPSARKTAEKGVRTTADLATLLTDLMADVISERTSIDVAETVVRLGNCLLKNAELQLRYGRKTEGSAASGVEPLRLISGR